MILIYTKKDDFAKFEYTSRKQAIKGIVDYYTDCEEPFLPYIEQIILERNGAEIYANDEQLYQFNQALHDAFFDRLRAIKEGKLCDIEYMAECIAR